MKIEGLEQLHALVERLEKALERVGEMERPLYGDVHVHNQSGEVALRRISDGGYTP